MRRSSQQTGIARAVLEAGSQDKLARGLGVTQQAISIWLDQGWVPLRRAEQIEQKFSIPRAELVNPKILEILAPPSQMI